MKVGLRGALLAAMASLAGGWAAAGPAVVLMPPDGAQFLPGARFDLSVEVDAASLPEPVWVTINGVGASKFFRTPAQKRTRPLPPHAVVWPRVVAPAPGTYRVEVHAGGTIARATWTVRRPIPGKAKNVVLLIADGMTVAQITAARLVSRGMTLGKYDGALAMDGMERIGLVHTSGIESILADSANTASALNTGHKTREEQTGSYPDGTPDPFDDPRVETLAEMISRKRGMAWGIVTTADWTDATTAATFGHCANRQVPCRARFAAAPLDGGGGPDVILGGGGRWMLQRTSQGTRNLYEEYAAAGFRVVRNATQLRQSMVEKPTRLLGTFHLGHMNVWLDRNVYKENLGVFTDQPGLAEMTRAALTVLGKASAGFYLVVEAASVDKQMHHLDADRALADLIEFDRTVADVLDWSARHAPDTLVVVTSDHAQSYDVYGTVDVGRFNAATDRAGKLSAIRIYGTAGFPQYKDANGDGFPDRWDVGVTLAGVQGNYPTHVEDFQVDPLPAAAEAAQRMLAGLQPNTQPSKAGIEMQSNLPPGARGATSSVHTLQDVPIFASGPGAERFGRVMDNTEVFFGMAAAIGLDPSADNGTAPADKTPAD